MYLKSPKHPDHSPKHSRLCMDAIKLYESHIIPALEPSNPLESPACKNYAVR